MKCNEDVTILKGLLKKFMISWAGLNVRSDAMRVQIVGKEDLSSLNETIVILLVKGGVMI